MEKLDKIQAQIEDILEEKGMDRDAFSNLVRLTHPADFARLFEDLDIDEMTRVFHVLPVNYAAQVIREVDDDTKYDILKKTNKEFLSQVIAVLPPDENADLIEVIGEKDAEEVYALMEKQKANEIKRLSSYKLDSAGSIMTTRFFSIPEDIVVDQAIKLLHGLHDIEEISNLYVIDANSQLKGVVSLKQLLVVQPSAPIAKIMKKDFISTQVNVDKEAVAREVRKYNLSAIPVLDADNKMVGLITFDDIMDIIHEEASEDIYKLAGTDVIHPVHDPVFRRVFLRMPWLIPTLIAETIVASIIKSYEVQLASQMVILVLFVPLLMATSGAVGNQSSTLVVRGLATGEIYISRFLRVFVNELAVGGFIGFACGLCMGIVGYVMYGSFMLGAIIFVSMLLSIFFSCSLGTILPVFFVKIKVDPAISSTPFIQCVSDIVSTTIYLSIANFLLISSVL